MFSLLLKDLISDFYWSPSALGIRDQWSAVVGRNSLANKLPWHAGGLRCFIEESLTWTLSTHPASSRESSHSTSLSKPNASGLTRIQWKQQQNKARHPHLQEVNITYRLNWCPTAMLKPQANYSQWRNQAHVHTGETPKHQQIKIRNEIL